MMTRMPCSCGKTSEVPDAFSPGEIASVTCPACGKSSMMRSPLHVTEDDMVSELRASGLDASVLGIETSPPKDGVPPAIGGLPCLQLTQFCLTDATGTPVAVEWLGRRLGAPGESELPPDAAAIAAENDGGADAAAWSAASDAPDADAPKLLVALEFDAKGAQKAARAEAKRKAKAEKSGARKSGEKKQKGAKAEPAGGGEAAGSSDSDDDSSDDDGGTCNWAQCDRCEKWRRLPAGAEYEAEALPEKWFCHMNPNSQRNSCDKPEERMGKGEIWGEAGEEDDSDDSSDVDSSDDEALKTRSDDFKEREAEARRVAVLEMKRREGEGDSSDEEAAKEAEAKREEARKAEEARKEAKAAARAAKEEAKAAKEAAKEEARAAKEAAKAAAKEEGRALKEESATSGAAAGKAGGGGWAAALLAKKQAEAEEAERKAEVDRQREAERSKPKVDPRAEAAARAPVGHLRLRGVLVPPGFEQELHNWRYVCSSPLRGWALQHRGPLRMHSLWLRTSAAWYWVRTAAPSFFPALAFKVLWAPPGSAANSPMAEEHVAASPVHVAYDSSGTLAPPPRGIGADDAKASTALAAGGAASRLVLRISAFYFADAEGKPVDLFDAMPRGGSSPDGTTTAREVRIIGQILPSVKPEKEEENKGKAAEAWPARMWLRSAPLTEWRVESTAGGSRAERSAKDGGGETYARFKIWVRSASGAWLMLMKPRADTAWKPPGSSADRPLPETLLARSLTCASEPPGGAGGLPCFTLSSCSAHRRDGELAGLSEIVGVQSPNSPKNSPSGVYVRGAVCGRPSAGAADAAAGGGLHVRSSDIVGAQVDYRTTPPSVWAQTASGYYQLLAPSDEYAGSFKLPGSTKADPLGEDALAGATLAKFGRKEEHPFTSKKGLVIPAVYLTEFELLDAAGAPASLLRTLPDGTLRAAEKAEKAKSSANSAKSAEKSAEKGSAAASNGRDSPSLAKLEVYVRARLLPASSSSAGSRPWLRAGPIRAWSVDFERKSPEGKAAPGLWVCTKSAALYCPAAHVATSSEAFTKMWVGCDGMLVHLGAEMLAGCRVHREPRNAVKLYNNVVNSAWGRLPAEILARHGKRREAVLYERRVTQFVAEALEEGGHAPFANKLREARKKFVEDSKARAERAAAAPAPRPTAPPKKVVLAPEAVSAPEASGSGSGAAEAPAEGAGSKRPPAEAGKGADGAPAAKAARVGGGKGAKADSASSASKEPDDAEVARTMLTVLRKVALMCKDASPYMLWNFARWLQAAQRGQKARPSWFVNIGDEMLGLGPDAGKEPAGGSPAPPKPEPTAAGGPGAKTAGGPGVAKAAEESAPAPAPTAPAAPAGESAGAGGAEPGAVPLGVSEEDLFGDDWDDEEDEAKPEG